MRRWSGLVGVACALALGTGCFQVKVAVALDPDGSVRVHESMWLTKGVVELLWDLGHEDREAGARFAKVSDELVARFATPQGAELETLRAAGVRSVERRVGASRDEWGMEASAVFDSIASMGAAWSATHQEDVMPTDALELAVSCDADRVCTMRYLQHERQGSATGGTPFDALGDALKADSAPAEESGRKPSKRQAKAKMDQVARMMEVMTTEAANLSLLATLTVPGEVLEPLPAGATVSGSTVTWAVSGAGLMASALNPAADAAGAPPQLQLLPAGQVRFRLTEGVAIPAGWAAAP